MKFSPSFIERLSSHFLMSEVIGKRMPIKKHGREFHGLCPFHNEKTSSFTVNDEKGFFHCFGCGAHGGSIEFVRRFDRLSFADAVESLAREAGFEITKASPAEQKKIEQQKTLYEVMEAAATWFSQQLLSLNGAIAKDYINNRGLRSDTIEKFRIGYAPDERAGLHQFLLKQGFPQKLQAEAGLIITPDSGMIYDRFRGRVMFPIRNPSGKVIAFGGRLIANNTGNKTMPKYLNSPETPLFKKGEILYNLDQAKAPAREGGMVVVMEGYMDVVMTAQSGINYGVATLGTAVTEEHLRLLWQLAKEPVLCLDGDAAGKRAMLRAAEVALPLLKPSYSLRYAVLPKGDDPDSYIQKHGKTSFEKILFSSRRLSQILWEDMLVPNYNLDLAEGRAAIDDAYQKLAAKINDTTVRQHYLSHFRKELWARAMPQKPQKTRDAKSQKLNLQQAKTTSPQVGQMLLQHHSTALEKFVARLLGILFQCPALLHKSNVEEALLRLSIRTSNLEMLRGILLLAISQIDVEDRELFTAYVRERMSADMFAEFLQSPTKEPLSENDAALIWNDAINSYEIAHLEYEYAELQERVGAFNNDEDLLRFIELQNTLRQARARRTFAPSDSDVA